ncbi:MAG: nicotinate phosphoribosyltransferase [Deltaproteobacteria bacterium]|nr:nicotinate phosphoribosyltransferase [Deltaproteobacteria bacterium]
MFHIATEEEIKSGRVTDIYFQRTLEILKAREINKRVVTEVWTKGLPNDWNWAILTGIEECIELLKGRPLHLNGLREGTVFHPFEPVLEIEGQYQDFALLETAILGFICQASGIATAAARCRKAAGERPVISFGARRMHPSIAPMIERSAFIGGCDGVAVVKSAEFIGEEPAGTMPHALILVIGDTVEATKAFHDIISEKVARVSLIDTFHDEKFAALEVAEALGENLFAVRLDTPSSRRGNFLQIIEEVRWELNLRGFQRVKIFVSGNIDVAAMQGLNQIVDAYGVGTYISNAPVIDFSMDIVEIEGEPIAKRGKLSGRKKLYRCPDCYQTKVKPRENPERVCECGGSMESLTTHLIKAGKVVDPLPQPQEIRKNVLNQLPHFSL